VPPHRHVPLPALPALRAHNIPMLLPLMVHCISLAGPAQNTLSPDLKQPYADLKGAQIRGFVARSPQPLPPCTTLAGPMQVRTGSLQPLALEGALVLSGCLTR